MMKAIGGKTTCQCVEVGKVEEGRQALPVSELFSRRLIEQSNEINGNYKG